MKQREQNELAFSKILILLLAAVGLLFVIWFAWVRPEEESANITSFDDCKAAGYPVQESFPEVCVAPDGQRFTNN
ncbi:MAG: hypothetical protein ACREGD_02175 [Candidatus Saccharimonadales bacterium]